MGRIHRTKSREDNMKIKQGDKFQLGEHRLICGDSSQKSTFKKLLHNEKIDLIITDPPYGVNMENKTKQILKKSNYSKITNDDININDLSQILYEAFTNCANVLKEDGSYYVFSPQGGDLQMMMMMMEKAGIRCRHQLIWVKDRPVFSMNRLDYDYQHEPILYGWTKKHHFYRRDNKQKSSVLNIKQVKNRLHPTTKPLKLVATLMYNNTQPNQLVLDCFGGGGTTLLCAEKLNRKCRMIEIDPHYCNVIIQRWEKLTGQKAEVVEV